MFDSVWYCRTRITLPPLPVKKISYLPPPPPPPVCSVDGCRPSPAVRGRHDAVLHPGGLGSIPSPGGRHQHSPRCAAHQGLPGGERQACRHTGTVTHRLTTLPPPPPPPSLNPRSWHKPPLLAQRDKPPTPPFRDKPADTKALAPTPLPPPQKTP